MNDSMPGMPGMSGQQMNMPADASAPGVIHDGPEQHAFVMAGTKSVFLCHLTMLHMEAHMYEVVLSATLPDYALEAYQRDQAAHPDRTYFLGNVEEDLMSIPDLITRQRTRFVANIWTGIPDRPVSEGWPWAGHDDLILVRNVFVTIDRVVHFRRFDFNQNYPNTLGYIMFGAGQEAFLYHQQTRIPDFDSVVALDAAPTWLSPTLLSMGVPVNFPSFPQQPSSGAAVYCNHPIKAGPHVVQMGGPRPSQEDPDDPGPLTNGYPITVGRTLWFNTKITNLVDPCGGLGDGGGG